MLDFQEPGEHIREPVHREMTSITIRDVTKKFGDVAALDRISLEIRGGELFFLLGPSGCGKTTLLRCIAGFYIPDQGRILFGEEDVTRKPPHLRNTGMMFQSYALWPHMTVEKNVAFGLEERRLPRDEIRARVGEALASVRMADYAKRKINQLSGGQQQRVALARAMVIRPRCLLLDEPLSNLDARLRLEMRTEIRRICKEHKLTAVYVTHDQKEALSVADRLAVLEAGHLRQVGTPEEVYRNPLSRFVADFIGETNFLEATFQGRDGARARVSTAFGTFEGRIPVEDWAPAEGENVLLSIRPEGWSLKDQGNGTNSVQGTIDEAVYLGEMAQYRFAARDQHLKIFELNPRHATRPGALVARANPEDVVILPRP